ISEGRRPGRHRRPKSWAGCGGRQICGSLPFFLTHSALARMPSQTRSSLILLLLLVAMATAEALRRTPREQPVITDGVDSGAEFEDASSSPPPSPQQPPPADSVYIVILDAGSSGTRAVAYQFRVKRSSLIGLEYISVYKRKSDQGLSNFERNPPRCRKMLQDLLGEVADGIPREVRGKTVAILRATAGFRLMKDSARAKIAKEARDVLRRSAFRIPNKDAELVRMLSGSDEAKYSWIAVNYLLGNFQEEGAATKPIVEMGGGSLQVAFEDPKLAAAADGEGGGATFRLHGGRTYAVHTHSYLGLGFRESVLRIIGYQQPDSEEKAWAQVSTPCLAPNLALNFSFGSTNIGVMGESSVGGERRVSICSGLARRLVQQLDVHDEVELAGDGANWPLYGIGSIYFLAQFLQQRRLAPDIRPDEATCQAMVSRGLRCGAFAGTVGDFTAAARQVCSDPPRASRFPPYYCISTSVVSALLSQGLRLPETARITVLGNNDALGWSLGLGLEFLASAESGGSPSASPRCGDVVSLAMVAMMMQLLRMLS
ncbi:hypothetical protein BOX15_Mlig025501g2, partial [Macrostomum lignano]